MFNKKLKLKIIELEDKVYVYKKLYELGFQKLKIAELEKQLAEANQKIQEQETKLSKSQSNNPHKYKEGDMIGDFILVTPPPKPEYKIYKKSRTGKCNYKEVKLIEAIQQALIENKIDKKSVLPARNFDELLKMYETYVIG